MKLYKAFGIYTFSTFLKSAIPFILIPIITKYLTPEEYGIANFYQVVLRLIAGIIMLGVPGSCTIFYFKHKREEYPSLLLNSVVSPIVLTLFIFITSFFLVDIVAPFFDIDEIWILFLAPIALLYLFPEVTYKTLRNQEKPIKFSIYNISQLIFHFTITTILIIVFKFDWLGILLGILISLIVMNFLSIKYLIKNKLIGGSLSLRKIKYALFLGSPLILQRIGGLLINKSDVLFISIMLGKDILGVYVVGYQIGMIVLLLQDAFGKAWQPYVFKKLNRNTFSDKIKIVKYSYLLMLLYLLFPIVIYFASPIIFEIFIHERYHDSIIIAPLIALAYSFLGMYKLVTLYIFYVKRTGLLSLFTLANGGINIILNYVFISMFGVMGAAYATIISMFIIFIITFVISNRVYPMPWNPLRLLKTI